MFRIGDFSRIARVSARLLRFYEEAGLFAPARADSQTGYRYYTVAQLGQLNRILVLKDLGFSLEQIRGIARRVPQTQLVEMPACGHSPHRDQPELLIDAVRRFVAA